MRLEETRVLNATLMLGGIPIFATSAAWSGVTAPVIALLIIAVAAAATFLTGWAPHLTGHVMPRTSMGATEATD
jgi:hypothetical protein